MSRPDHWTEIEDRLLLGGFNNHLSSAEIAALLKGEGYGIRSADAIRRRYQRIMGKEEKRYNGCGDMDAHRRECARAKHSDESFQRAMQQEGYQRGCSKEPGTQSPKVVGSTSVGSCTSSAGWAV